MGYFRKVDPKKEKEIGIDTLYPNGYEEEVRHGLTGEKIYRRQLSAVEAERLESDARIEQMRKLWGPIILFAIVGIYHSYYKVASWSLTTQIIVGLTLVFSYSIAWQLTKRFGELNKRIEMKYHRKQVRRKVFKYQALIICVWASWNGLAGLIAAR